MAHSGDSGQHRSRDERISSCSRSASRSGKASFFFNGDRRWQSWSRGPLQPPKWFSNATSFRRSARAIVLDPAAASAPVKVHPGMTHHCGTKHASTRLERCTTSLPQDPPPQPILPTAHIDTRVEPRTIHLAPRTPRETPRQRVGWSIMYMVGWSIMYM